ncbi:MAG: VWA domain-containing protein, partial [Acidobacteriaceae bacterium]|nr:VWA domain-containing protein [Acidobacteriaceae bacterium]
DGFPLDQSVEEPYKTVISTANRFNVSFYTIDSRGLNSTNLNDAANAQLRSAAAASRAQFGRNAGAVNIQEANEFDTAMDAGKYNMQNTLADLANSTGGFLIANTNDFRGLLRRAVDDTETYYEITYNPNLQKYDGSFRPVQVKSDRPTVRIQSRAGYFALPQVSAKTGTVLAPYEVPLLQALSAKPLVRTFDFHAAGLHFRSGNSSKCSLVLDLPLSSVDFRPIETPALDKDKKDKDKAAAVKRMKAEFAYLLLIKDANGDIIRSFRGDVPLQPAETQMDALRVSHFIYKESFDLPAGRYTLEAGVLDRNASSTSVRKSVLLIPPASSPLAISSISTVRNMQDKSDSASPDDPFLMSDKVVTPTLSPLTKADLSNGLSFYLVIYTDKTDSTKPQLTVQLSRDGANLGGGDAPLSGPDALGRIPYVATIPADKLQPGNYNARFVARQGSKTAEETTSFTIQ